MKTRAEAAAQYGVRTEKEVGSERYFFYNMDRTIVDTIADIRKLNWWSPGKCASVTIRGLRGRTVSGVRSSSWRFNPRPWTGIVGRRGLSVRTAWLTSGSTTCLTCVPFTRASKPGSVVGSGHTSMGTILWSRGKRLSAWGRFVLTVQSLVSLHKTKSNTPNYTNLLAKSAAY